LANLSRARAKKVLVSLKSLLRDAMRRGNVAQNVSLAVKITASERDKKKIKVGVDIPTPDEIRAIIHAATGRIRPCLLRQFSAACVVRNCAAWLGRMSILNGACCMFAAVLTATVRLASRSRGRASAQSRSDRLS
jgi:hypothetical protein